MTLAARAPALRQYRISHLQDLVNELTPLSRRGTRLDRLRFTELFRDAQSVLEASDDELAELIRVSRPTIGRWARGETAPHPIGMPGVFKTLADLGKRKLRTYGHVEVEAA